ncbi:hypothetical protein B566_EDAN010819 [Ephemera danica]|nr:hypothetical protein B566_EDAN010819 [Ephemera danica]
MCLILLLDCLKKRQLVLLWPLNRTDVFIISLHWTSPTHIQIKSLVVIRLDTPISNKNRFDRHLTIE